MKREKLLRFIPALTLLFGVGMAAIGASGALAAGFGVAFGKGFVSGDRLGVTYTPARCADLLEYAPDAPNCEAAATAHHFDEVVTYRLAAGVIGVITLGGLLVLRRLLPGFWRTPRLPDGLVATAGATAFGLAAGALLLSGAGALLVDGSTGAGADLSGGIVSLAVFAGFASSLLRTMNREMSIGELPAGVPDTAAE